MLAAAKLKALVRATCYINDKNSGTVFKKQGKSAGWEVKKDDPKEIFDEQLAPPLVLDGLALPHYFYQFADHHGRSAPKHPPFHIEIGDIFQLELLGNLDVGVLSEVF